MSDPAPPDADEDRPQRLFSPAFWVAIGFAALCILAGIGLVVLGPTLFPPKP